MHVTAALHKSQQNWKTPHNGAHRSRESLRDDAAAVGREGLITKLLRFISRETITRQGK